MKTLIAKLRGVSPYSQSRHYIRELEQGESQDDNYRRTWRGHLHTDNAGMVFIPANSLKNCLSDAAKFMSISVPGKGKATYTKNFEAGIMVAQSAPLGVHKDKVDFEALFLPSDGRRGGPKRVMKYYPIIPEWETEAEFIIVDETVLQSSVKDKTRTVFQEVLEGAGQYIGIGRFRPRNNGYYGRFSVESVKEV
ncbi:hypothetical protein [Reyranella sp.]|uniref:hypothetical protein n=1 Tax=Reyranella sp. TaxID=1929291 RepID=UPI000BDAB362|nr:hypothetical protein [Reyranella sp.]OYY35558.1 MAG: hypothetical protein B7Y57_25600 [Rhodospirillales bacterium 35-66-84]OYZ91428.1 MAG: hypothetical protein B7Y08_25470 [Rhodospirillales bacterium 24-66-33]OZB26258.1 MAG: hypothetical protein B7X63_09980 [Rhodospirillales bacterium 39-66-50]HQS15022.1 hypothetical protein [Reyranella sp.]HQT10831.1 hypothetical protein [Reyranella sp.]